jgi:predicted phosphodiesterase
LKYLPDNLIAIPGQHDLPQHNLDLIEKSGFNALMEAGKINYFNKRHIKYFPDDRYYSDYLEYNLTDTDSDACLYFGIPFGNSWDIKLSGMSDMKSILMLHQLTWQKEPWPGADPEGNARKLLKENPDFDLIITGDNHQAFTEEYKGRLLVNPGSIMRSTAKQIDFQPRVYLWNAESNTVQIEYLPIEKSVVSREHLEMQEERTNRLDSFIEVLQSEEFEIGVSFEENIKHVLKSTKISKSVKDKVLEAVGL